MSWLVCSDLHLTTKPEHEYRWEFLDWLAQQAKDLRARQIFILGDLTDAKDNHSAAMVVCMTNAITKLARVCPVNILYGNHDGPSQDRPYWSFLGHMENVHYYTTWSDVEIEDGDTYVVLMAPWGSEEAAIQVAQRREDLSYMFMHASVSGVRTENGTVLEGEVPAKFLPEDSRCKVFSGDIHLPQIVGDVEYVGAPYHVHYGDPFDGDIVVIHPEENTHERLHWEGSPKLHALKVEVASGHHWPQRFRKGDRVKLTATSALPLLPGDWQAAVKEWRAALEAQGVTMAGANLVRTPMTSTPVAPSARRSDAAIVRTYAHQQKYDDTITAVGVALVKKE